MFPENEHIRKDILPGWMESFRNLARKIEKEFRAVNLHLQHNNCNEKFGTTVSISSSYYHSTNKVCENSLCANWLLCLHWESKSHFPHPLQTRQLLRNSYMIQFGFVCHPVEKQRLFVERVACMTESLISLNFHRTMSVCVQCAVCNVQSTHPANGGKALINLFKNSQQFLLFPFHIVQTFSIFMNSLAFCVKKTSFHLIANKMQSKWVLNATIHRIWTEYLLRQINQIFAIMWTWSYKIAMMENSWYHFNKIRLFHVFPLCSRDFEWNLFNVLMATQWIIRI